MTLNKLNLLLKYLKLGLNRIGTLYNSVKNKQ